MNNDRSWNCIRKLRTEINIKGASGEAELQYWLRHFEHTLPRILFVAFVLGRRKFDAGYKTVEAK